MKVLITGTEGYIGSLLAPLLMQQGHDVIGVDTGFYKVGWLYNGTSLTPKTLNKDLRHIDIADLQEVEAIIHLAELSNDPLGQLAPQITYEINHEGSVRLAKLAKTAGVPRFIYTSSCSVYGFASEDFVTEESAVNPQTAYAKCKVLVERDVRELADAEFCPTFLRNATAYGASPRMRFDIVLNNLAGLAQTTGEIKMISDGTPWRPLVHVLDICSAIACVLEAPLDLVRDRIFNVGDTNSNYQVREIAEIVAEVFTGCQLSFGKSDPDNRSYRVSFDKITNTLPGFKCKWDAKQGAKQLFEIFQQIDMSKDTFEFRGFTRLKQLEYLLRTHQIDSHFFWKQYL
ncbi:SDR family oxidoreductase [Oscillatoria sp. FACHB-1406]|uniref:NAD-dependent epimerase/dehydratase family protein n=1 Tax=Oscillatoria sp. FACHB-1406 TaxID=2692846 RepID=UPI001688BF1E|nr:SDR family oxidoreductase [Oscillatoria sp. FACHB-1406]MBD2580499.1 SDR family oxidoreductase [Oscillatoria sp. FACHB-1406]